jgi:hypothetical protein
MENGKNIVIITNINVIASVNIFNDYQVHLVKMHESSTRPKQFEDSKGNLWNARELSHFSQITTGA